MSVLDDEDGMASVWCGDPFEGAEVCLLPELIALDTAGSFLSSFFSFSLFLRLD